MSASRTGALLPAVLRRETVTVVVSTFVVVGWLVGWLAGWLVGWLVGGWFLFVCLSGWAGWLVGC